MCSCWTAYETLSAELWEHSVNSIGEIAQLVCKHKSDTDSDGIQGKNISLQKLFEYNLDLRGCMGTLLKGKFDFTSEQGIREAFSICSGDKNNRQDSELHYIEQCRHLIQHRAGIIDDKFRRNPHTSMQVNSKLIFNGAQLGEMINNLIAAGCNKIEQTLHGLHPTNKFGITRKD